MRLLIASNEFVLLETSNFDFIFNKRATKLPGVNGQFYVFVVTIVSVFFFFAFLQATTARSVSSPFGGPLSSVG